MSVAPIKDILIVEPFNGGSHGQLIKSILADSEIGPRCTLVSLPAKKWHWRARTSALYFSQTIPFSNYRAIFTSSVLNLAELIALRPDLSQLKKIVYFHENQLVYPVRELKDRDFQYGYNQILTSLVADIVVFNSSFNMESFLSSISSHLKLIPDHRPKNLQDIMRPKCRVLYFPLTIDQVCCANDQPVGAAKSGESIQENDRLLNQSTVPFVSGRDSPMQSDVQGAHTINTLAQKCCSLPDKELQSCATDSRNLTLRPTNLEYDIANCDTGTTVADRHCDTGETLADRHCDIGATVADWHCDTGATVADRQDPSAPPVFKKACPGALQENGTCLHIVWPHRWEHDKDPESFFKALLQLQSEGSDFRVSVVGETFTDVPDIFHLAQSQLSDKIVTWGHQTRQSYLRVLDSAHVVVSTALHEFFGVSMLEATAHGCYPLCPKRLVYPEIYPEECLYSTQAQLVKRLRRFCQRPDLVKAGQLKGLAERFSWAQLQEDYRKLLLQ